MNRIDSFQLGLPRTALTICEMKYSPERTSCGGCSSVARLVSPASSGSTSADLRQVAGGGVGKETRDRLEVDRLLGAELTRLRHGAEVIDPGYSRCVELVQNCASNRFVTAHGRRDFVRGQMPERGCRQQIEAVRNSRADHAAMVTVVNRKRLGERIVERQIVLIVEAHGLVFGRVLDAIVRLLSHIVDPGEAVVGARLEHAVRRRVVAFLVTACPSVIEVGRGAIVIGMKRRDRRAGNVRIRISAAVSAVRMRDATKSLDASCWMRILRARLALRGAVIGTVLRECQHT